MNHRAHYNRIWLTTVLLMFCSTGWSQVHDRYYHPLTQNAPPGRAAGWLNAIRRYDPTWMQPVKIEVSGGGQVEAYAGSPQPMAVSHSPALLAVNVGHYYRLKVSNMPDFPGLEVFPTIELLDRLHPPAGRENDFPVPIIITQNDIRTAQSGQLVTRVIYLEQPQIAQTLDPLKRELPQSVPPSENALKEADRLGRPMAIIRIGGRQPSPNSPAAFFGNGGSVQTRQPMADLPATVRMNSPQTIQRTSGRVVHRRQP